MSRSFPSDATLAKGFFAIGLVAFLGACGFAAAGCKIDHGEIISATRNGDAIDYQWWDVEYADGTSAICSSCDQTDGRWTCTDCSMITDLPVAGK
jgi:hypothetical protein